MARDLWGHWKPCERPSLERLAEMFLVANWTFDTTQTANPGFGVRVDSELYYDAISQEHFRLDTHDNSVEWYRAYIPTRTVLA